MNRTRIAQLGILAVLVAVWVSSATLPPPASPPAPAPPARAASRAAHRAHAQATHDATTFDLNEATERLHARLDAAPRPRAPERNLFEFAAPPTPRVTATSTPTPAPAEPPGLTAPPFALTGVAENKKDDATERTAILTGDNQIYFAKVGDRVIGLYDVVAVGADAIELREVASGQIVRLGLH